MRLVSATVGGLLGLGAAAQLAPRQSTADLSSLYVPSPGSPGFYANHSSAAVTIDQHSVLLDGKRYMIFSGEFHPWRLPSIPLWRDVLEKMKAGGFTGVSIYWHWGMVEGKQGVLNFEGHRSITKFLDVAKEVGLLVIVRPGPYINAETTAGGYPGWLTNIADVARSNGTEFTKAWKPWIERISRDVAPYQYPDGPVIGMQSENEFGATVEGDENSYGHTDHMKWIEETMRANGITKVPLTQNDYMPNGAFSFGPAKVDLYGWDSYPNGFDCRIRSAWKEANPNIDSYHEKINPAEPLYIAEFQGGSLDNWQGQGTAACYEMVNEQFASVFYKNNYASGIAIQSLYMTYGGTNWGNLATPIVYTSYDFASPISEDRTLTTKYTELKLQGLFLHASPHYHLAGRIGAGTNFTNSSAIYTTQLTTLKGESFYIVRQTTNNNTARAPFTLNMGTSVGEVKVDGSLEGRESKILVGEYGFGKSVLRWTSAEVATWATIDGADHIILYAQNQTIQAVLPTTSKTISISGAPGISTKIVNGTATISGKPPVGLTKVSFGRTAVWVSDKAWLAPKIWAPRVSGNTGTGVYDLSPRTGGVFVFGPYLVRSATIKGSTVAITGDVLSGQATELEILVPASVGSVTFNGKSVQVQKTATGTLKGSVVVKDLTPKLPNLKTLEWKCVDSLPEVEPEFDDSKWVEAWKTSTARPARYQPLGGKLMLYADEYGYHQGTLLYRGRFDGNATGVRLNVQGGFNFGFSTFLNGVFLSSGQGRSNRETGGLDEDWPPDTFKAPRGIRGYELIGGGDFSSWKLTGNVQGENNTDILRGPLNAGGLYVERIGAIYPNYTIPSSWNSSRSNSSCTPFAGLTGPGIKAYKTKFKLNIDENTDVPIAFKFERTPTSNYRTLLFVNGWQFGKFISNFGPQTEFPIPEGILNHRGENDILLTIWSLDAQGAKIANVELTPKIVLWSGKGVVKALAA
ncbi:glycoside hydrolase family 35 protein [Ceratobasidium sp. AG-I]|nr:glycoside hydrolase family 35 protein [Ceratobasidium sp. AG-I]